MLFCGFYCYVWTKIPRNFNILSLALFFCLQYLPRLPFQSIVLKWYAIWYKIIWEFSGNKDSTTSLYQKLVTNFYDLQWELNMPLTVTVCLTFFMEVLAWLFLGITEQEVKHKHTFCLHLRCNIVGKTRKKIVKVSCFGKGACTFCLHWECEIDLKTKKLSKQVVFEKLHAICTAKYVNMLTLLIYFVFNICRYREFLCNRFKLLFYTHLFPTIRRWYFVHY